MSTGRGSYRLGSVSRLEAETLADGLAYQHGKRILALRVLAIGEASSAPIMASQEGRQTAHTNTPSTCCPDLQAEKNASAKVSCLRDGRTPHLMRLVNWGTEKITAQPDWPGKD